MKKIILLLLLFSSFSSFSQNFTSVDEYNYMVKGYESSVTSGIDIKKGYAVSEINTYNYDSYNFDFRAFYRLKDKSLAGIIVVSRSKIWNNVYYIGIPINNPDLMTQYDTNIGLWDKTILLYYTASLSRLYTQQISDSKFQP